MVPTNVSIATSVFLVIAALANAGIPEPDAILYGTVTIDGVPVTAADDVTVFGRVDGVAEPVGSYHMGDNAGAGDNYVLRIRLESLADDSEQSDNAAIEGDTVRLFVQQRDGPELEAIETFTISQRGEIQMLDLTAVSCPDSDGDGVCDKADICDGFDDNIDTDGDGVPDGCDVCPGADDNADADEDGAPDGCDNCPDHANADQADCDDDGIGDVCAIADGLSEDCNENGIPDNCDIADGTSADDNENGIPDECEEPQCGDCPTDGPVNGPNGSVGAEDLAYILGNWGPLPPDADPEIVCIDNLEPLPGNGIIGPEDLAKILGSWGDCPG